MGCCLSIKGAAGEQLATSVFVRSCLWPGSSGRVRSGLRWKEKPSVHRVPSLRSVLR